MLLLIGSKGNKLESPVANRFGHADYFILFDTKTNLFEAIENIDEGHNHENLQKFLNKGVEVFIVGNIGPYAFEVINTFRSKVYFARGMSVKDAINKFLKDELEQMTEPTAKRSIRHGKDEDNHHKHNHDGEHYGRGKHQHDE